MYEFKIINNNRYNLSEYTSINFKKYCDMILELNFEHKILIVLFIISYFGAMFIQVSDPKTAVKASDWFLGFITSVVGAVITYFVVAAWVNLGTRMAATIVASLVSYRTFKFIVSNEAQEDFAKGFWSGVMSILKRVVNNSDNKNQNDPNPN